jgi:hypothetical protein
MDYLTDSNEKEESEQLHKVNFNSLINNVVNCSPEDKIRLLKFLYADLDLLTIKQASDKLGITPNGVRSTKELIEIGGKKFVRLRAES